MTQETTLYTNIGLLVTNDSQTGEGLLGQIENAAFLVEDGKIAWVGSASEAPAADQQVDLDGACLIPGFVDSHSHPVFAGDRTQEFLARMKGQKYQAGGIKSTVKATRAASEEELTAVAKALRNEMLQQGATTFEAKTGYGLDLESEAKLAKVARSLTEEVTFLGAHVVPEEYQQNPDAYVDIVCGDMLEECKPYVKWIDVFCEENAFTTEQSLRILQAGKQAGLGLRLHAAQLNPSEIIADAVALDVASIDHCTFLSDADVDALAGSNTVATLLPGAEFSTRQPYPDAQRLIDAGVTVALATDCNPGTSFTSSMPFCLAVAVRDMKFTPEQALWAATKGSAQSLRRQDVGHLGVGAQADFIELTAPSWVHFFYRPGVPLIKRVWSQGKLITA